MGPRAADSLRSIPACPSARTCLQPRSAGPDSPPASACRAGICASALREPPHKGRDVPTPPASHLIHQRRHPSFWESRGTDLLRERGRTNPCGAWDSREASRDRQMDRSHSRSRYRRARPRAASRAGCDSRPANRPASAKDVASGKTIVGSTSTTGLHIGGAGWEARTRPVRLSRARTRVPIRYAPGRSQASNRLHPRSPEGVSLSRDRRKRLRGRAGYFSSLLEGGSRAPR